MAVTDLFSKLPVVSGQPKHKRVDGTESGQYFCMNCGKPIDSKATGHDVTKCPYNPQLVNELRRINSW